MNIWNKFRGKDMEMTADVFESRVQILPADYQMAWKNIDNYLWNYADLTGRNLIPILDGVLGFLEEGAMEGLSIQKVLGTDLEVFCSDLATEEGVKTYRDKIRQQLNKNIKRKLG